MKDEILRLGIIKEYFDQVSDLYTYLVVLIKKDEEFHMNLSAEAPNFSTFTKGEIIATQPSGNYVVEQDQVWILFPNPNVKIGLRAGLVLTETI